MSLLNTPLASSLPRAQFREGHHRIVDAPRQAVWDALHQIRWGDLTITRPLFLIRSLGRTRGTALDLERRLVEPPSPGAPIHEEEPAYSTSALVGRPWTPSGGGVPVDDLAQVQAYAEPGYLKYGMEWLLSDLGGRTLLETRTLCEATDASARRAFTAYWAVIRPWSGIIRRDLLAATARRAERG